MVIFIAHSFHDSKKAIINEIKECIRKYNPEWTIQTGERPQNNSISKKVKQLIDKCDIFIAVYTSDIPLNDNESGKYIPSLWVIQESGYACGRERETIFLVDQNIDSSKLPQFEGDKEYIPFTEPNMSEAFCRLFLVFNNICKIKMPETLLETNRPATSETTEFKHDILYQMWVCEQQNDIVGLERIFENEYTNSKPEEWQVKKWKLKILCLKSLSGNQDALNELKELAEDEKNTNAVITYANVYKQMDDCNQAIHILEEALNKSVSDKDKAGFLAQISDCYLKSNDYKKALINIIDSELFEGNKLYCLGWLLNFAKEKDDSNLITIIAENILDLDPFDVSVRFDLAYYYSNRAQNVLALYHYKKIIEADKKDSPVALNNIACVYSSLGMESKSIEFFNKAIKRNVPVSYFNIINKKIQRGFFDEANLLIDKLEKLNLTQEDSGKIAKSKAEMHKILEEEREKEKKALSKINSLKAFMKKHALAYFDAPKQKFEFSGFWLISFKDVEKIKININYENNLITSSFDLPSKQSDTSSLNMSFSFGVNPFLTDKNVLFEGEINNFSGKYEISNQNKTFLSSSKSKGFFVVSQDCRTIDVLEIYPEYAFYTWQKIDN